MEHLSIAAHALEPLGAALFHISSLSMGLCEVGFPSFTRPAHLKLAALRVVLEQRQLPKVLQGIPASSARRMPDCVSDCSLHVTLSIALSALQYCLLAQSVAPGVLDGQEDTIALELKAAKLAAVEKLLWGTRGHCADAPQPGGKHA